MSAAEKAALGSQVTGCGVNVGAVAVVESCDGMLLLTRRAKHLRTYPNIWVPPGTSQSHDRSVLVVLKFYYHLVYLGNFCSIVILIMYATWFDLERMLTSVRSALVGILMLENVNKLQCIEVWLGVGPPGVGPPGFGNGGLQKGGFWRTPGAPWSWA